MNYFLTLILLLPLSTAAQVLIITHNYNRPDFIELQDKAFKKFLKDDYRFVVFNDATNKDMRKQINDTCKKLNLECIRIPQEIHSRPYLPREPHESINTSMRHAHAVQYSLDVLGFDHNGIVFIIDADIVLIRPFSIEKYMKDKDIASRIFRPHNKAYYCSPVLCILNMNNLPNKKTLNFNCGPINGTSGDTGAWSYYYLKNHPELNVVPVSVLYSHQLFLADRHINKAADLAISEDVKSSFYAHAGFNNTEIKFLLNQPDTFEFYLDNNFLHYRGGSNHTKDSQQYHDRKFEIFSEFFNDILGA